MCLLECHMVRCRVTLNRMLAWRHHRLDFWNWPKVFPTKRHCLGSVGTFPSRWGFPCWWSHYQQFLSDPACQSHLCDDLDSPQGYPVSDFFQWLALCCLGLNGVRLPVAPIRESIVNFWVDCYLGFKTSPVQQMISSTADLDLKQSPKSVQKGSLTHNWYGPSSTL